MSTKTEPHRASDEWKEKQTHTQHSHSWKYIFKFFVRAAALSNVSRAHPIPTWSCFCCMCACRARFGYLRCGCFGCFSHFSLYFAGFLPCFRFHFGCRDVSAVAVADENRCSRDERKEPLSFVRLERRIEYVLAEHGDAGDECDRKETEHSMRERSSVHSEMCSLSNGFGTRCERADNSTQRRQFLCLVATVTHIYDAIKFFVIMAAACSCRCIAYARATVLHDRRLAFVSSRSLELNRERGNQWISTTHENPFASRVRRRATIVDKNT